MNFLKNFFSKEEVKFGLVEDNDFILKNYPIVMPINRAINNFFYPFFSYAL